jgi:hypothetical protein
VTAEPIVLARFCQEWLDLVALEDEPYRSRFFERIPPEIRAQIDASLRVAWLPLSIHVKLADVMLEAFGSTRAHDYYRRSFVRAVKGPVFGPLFVTGVRLFGVSPATIIRWGSRGYEAGFKNAGRIVGRPLGPGRARLEFSELPAVCTASEGWVMSMMGTTYGIYDVLGVEGVIRADMRALHEGRVNLDFEWSEGKGGGPAAAG